MIKTEKNPTLNEFGLSANSMRIISNIFEKYSGINKAILYGSRAKGNFREGSDIDITLETSSLFTRENLLDIVTDFDESDLPYFVDISIKSSLTNKDLLSHIERSGKPLWERKV